MKQRSIKIGEVLFLEGLLTKQQLAIALDIQKKTGEFLGDILVKNKMISESELAISLSKQFEIPFTPLNFDEIDWEVPRHFVTLLADQNCFPYAQDSASITTTIHNPLDAWMISQIESSANGRSVKFTLSTKTKIQEAINELRKRAFNGKGRRA